MPELAGRCKEAQAALVRRGHDARFLANLRANEFSGECDLSGGTNAAPTVQGIADVSWLVGNGANIYTN